MTTPDGAIERYQESNRSWGLERPLGPVRSIVDKGAKPQSLAEWLAFPEQASLNNAAFEQIFAEIRDSGRPGQIYAPAAPEGRAYFLANRLEPWCVFELYGDGGRGSSRPTILHSQYGAPAFKLNHYLNQDSPPPNATSCQGSILRDVLISTSGNATQLWASGGAYITGVTIRPTVPSRGTDGIFGPYWIYLVVTGGNASVGSDPTASWPKVDGTVFTDGTLTLQCLAAGGIWVRATITAYRVQISSFYGDQWLLQASAGDGIADSCLFEFCGGSQSAHAGDGMYLKGADANVCKTVLFECMSNAGWGLHDESFLGNTHDTPHAETNALGPYNIGGDNHSQGHNNAFTLVLNPYSESDQPPGVAHHPAYVFGGVPGAGWRTDCTAKIFQANSIANMPPIQTRYVAGQRVLEVSFGDGNNALKPQVMGFNVLSEDLQTVYDNPGLQYSTADTAYAPKGCWQIMWGGDWGSACLGFTGKEAAIGAYFAWMPRVLLWGAQADAGIGSREAWRWGSEWRNGQRTTGDALFGPDLKTGYSNQVRRDWLMERPIRNGRGANAAWSAGLSVPFAGFIVVPSTDNGHAYSASGAGTTVGPEPVWPTTAGGTVIDGGGITWTEVGAAALWREYGSVGGYLPISVTGLSTLALTQLDIGFLTRIIELTGVPSGAFTLILPALSGYERWIYNHTTVAATIRTPSGTGPSIASGMGAGVWCNGTNILRQSADVAP